MYSDKNNSRYKKNNVKNTNKANPWITNKQ